MSDTLNALRTIIEDRRGKSADSSYVAKMLAKGINKISQKVGEEATETIIAALAEGKKELIAESADLLFHLSLLWAERGVKPDDVMKELRDRMGTSGIDEKKGRTKK